jgi:AmmeMemoRadiSam system protein B
MNQPATSDTSVREPAVAGLFYPGDPVELRRILTDLFSRVPISPAPTTPPVALVSPHAGYSYSGLTAAHAYRLLEGFSFSTIVIVSPSHREYFKGVSVYPGEAYRTPLGTVHVDRKMRDRLIACNPIISASHRGHRDEHALEVQIPFLQFLLKDFHILPIVMGDQERETCTILGDALGAALAGTPSLLIASTDLSHFHPADTADRLDRVVLRDVAAFDEDRLLLDLDAHRAEACGGGPLAAVLRGAKALGAGGARILHHSTSGDVTGDNSSVVGYFAAIVQRGR